MSEKNGGSKAGVIRNDHSKEISPAGQAASSNGPGGSRKRKGVYVDRKNLSQGRINRAEADAAKQSGEHKTAHDDVMKLKRQTKLLQDQFRKSQDNPCAFCGLCLPYLDIPGHLPKSTHFPSAPSDVEGRVCGCRGKCAANKHVQSKERLLQLAKQRDDTLRSTTEGKVGKA